MPRPRIAIATCDKHDRDKVDDALLIEAFAERDCEAEPVVWDDGDAAWGAFDLCLVSSTWDYNRSYAEFLAWAWRVEAATALLNPAETIAWSSDKTYLRELAELALSQLDEVPLYGRVDLVEGPTGEPCLIELELIEPNLYLVEHPPAAAALAEAALLRIDVDA
jgi:hypothetical protein